MKRQLPFSRFSLYNCAVSIETISFFVKKPYFNTIQNWVSVGCGPTVSHTMYSESTPCCKLNTWFQLSISHCIFFHPHKGCIWICFRITVPFPQICSFFCISFNGPDSLLMFRYSFAAEFFRFPIPCTNTMFSSCFNAYSFFAAVLHVSF